MIPQCLLLTEPGIKPFYHLPTASFSNHEIAAGSILLYIFSLKRYTRQNVLALIALMLHYVTGPLSQFVQVKTTKEEKTNFHF